MVKVRLMTYHGLLSSELARGGMPAFTRKGGSKGIHGGGGEMITVKYCECRWIALQPLQPYMGGGLRYTGARLERGS